MALEDKEIHALNAATSVSDADVLPIVQGTSNFKASMLILKTYVLTGFEGGGASYPPQLGHLGF